MKVIFITREGYRLPGARVRCYFFAEGLKKKGIDTEVLSFADHLCALDGEREKRMSLLKRISLNRAALTKLSKEKGALLYLQRVHYHSFAPFLAHLLKKNKLILDMDDWEMKEKPRYYLRFLPSSKAEFFLRQIARRCEFLVAASHFLKTFLSSYNTNVYYIPTGVDTDLFKPRETRRDKKITISWIGTIHRRDNVENILFLIDIFCRLKDRYSNICLEIAGDGLYGNRIKALIAGYGRKDIIWKGWINPELIPGYLSTIDIGTMPLIQKIKFNQAKSPLKLFEYMAMGKPTISSNIGEARYIIKNGKSGFLAEDREQFIRSLEELILNPQLRESIGREAKRVIEKDYSLSVVVEKLYKIVKSIPL
ncbi:MAG TPA: glycosyltransferase family 1 protein [Candidatus Omnitrophica bacterium]|nr:glycosyltransferase family 1 protein [Candidatus Omnitrophota bacterium]